LVQLFLSSSGWRHYPKIGIYGASNCSQELHILIKSQNNHSSHEWSSGTENEPNAVSFVSYQQTVLASNREPTSCISPSWMVLDIQGLQRIQRPKRGRLTPHVTAPSKTSQILPCFTSQYLFYIRMGVSRLTKRLLVYNPALCPRDSQPNLSFKSQDRKRLRINGVSCSPKKQRPVQANTICNGTTQRTKDPHYIHKSAFPYLHHRKL
jgi:hypothetical protein